MCIRDRNWGNPRISAPTTQLRLLISQHRIQRKACKESNHPIDPSHLRKPRAKCPNPKAKELTKLVSPITRRRRGGARLDVSFPGLSQRECVSQIRVLCQCPGSRIKPGQLHPQPLYAPIHIHACIHAYMHTCMHTYIHTCASLGTWCCCTDSHRSCFATMSGRSDGCQERKARAPELSRH